MRRQMAHEARPAVRGRPTPPRSVVGGAPRGRRRFIGPALLGAAAILLVAFAVGSTPTASAGPQGAVAGVSVTAAPPRDDRAPEGIRATAPPCEQGDVLTEHLGPDDWSRAILDTRFMLPAGWAPVDLVSVTDAGIAGRGTVRALVIDDLRALAHAASAAGVRVSVDSAYRSFDQQVASFESYVRGFGEDAALRTVARPGHSEHQLGTTLDFEGDLEWLAANAPAFGFVMSYPPERSPEGSCYRHEAWHYRYVGRDAAVAVTASGLSLREWLWLERR